MPRAIWKDTVLAEASESEVEIVEGNVYFPPESLRMEHLQESSHQSTCPWKGLASYYHVAVDGDVNRDAAWSYPEPSNAARQIKDHVAFWRGVRIER